VECVRESQCDGDKICKGSYICGRPTCNKDTVCDTDESCSACGPDSPCCDGEGGGGGGSSDCTDPGVSCDTGYICKPDSTESNSKGCCPDPDGDGTCGGSRSPPSISNPSPKDGKIVSKPKATLSAEVDTSATTDLTWYVDGSKVNVKKDAIRGSTIVSWERETGKGNSHTWKLQACNSNGCDNTGSLDFVVNSDPVIEESSITPSGGSTIDTTEPSPSFTASDSNGNLDHVLGRVEIEDETYYVATRFFTGGGSSYTLSLSKLKKLLRGYEYIYQAKAKDEEGAEEKVTLNFQVDCDTDGDGVPAKNSAYPTDKCQSSSEKGDCNDLDDDKDEKRSSCGNREPDIMWSWSGGDTHTSSGDNTVWEGETITPDVSGTTDPDDNYPIKYGWEISEGTGSLPGDGDPESDEDDSDGWINTETPTYRAPLIDSDTKEETIRVTAQDSEGASTKMEKTLKVKGLSPKVESFDLGQGDSNGDTVAKASFSASESSPGAPIDRCYINWTGSESPATVCDGKCGSPETHDYGSSGTYTAVYECFDNYGNRGSDRGSIKVPKTDAPTCSIDDYKSSMDEGTSYTMEASASDPNGDDLTYSWKIVSGGGSLGDKDGLGEPFNAPSVDREQTTRVEFKADDGSNVCEDRENIDVEQVSPSCSLSAPETVDEGGKGDLDACSSSGDGLSYSWSIDDGPGSITGSGCSTTYEARHCLVEGV